MIKNKIFILFLLFFSLWAGADKALAQQQIMFTQYMFNGLAINPAYAGSHQGLSLTALGRKQWVGIEGAPSTQTFSAHAPVHNNKIGLGLLFLHDKIGVTNQTGIYGSYAYRILLGEDKTLSMGLQAGFSHIVERLSEAFPNDNRFSGQDINHLEPNFGFGLYYYTNRFYAGASIPQLAENIFDRKNKISYVNTVRHYFVMAGYVLDLNESLKLKPNLLVKAVEGAPVELDLNANLLIKEVLWVGLSWRSFDSVDALLQLQLTKNLQFGYAYDFATAKELSAINGGSHELMLNYRINLSKGKFITPRYF